MRQSLIRLRSDIEQCNKCKGLSKSGAICRFGKAIGLTYNNAPKVPLKILFVAESPPKKNFFYDETCDNAFRSKLFNLLKEADVASINNIEEFNERGYFLADAINCRWDKKKKPIGQLTKIRQNCSEYFKRHLLALKPKSIVLIGKQAKLSYIYLKDIFPSIMNNVNVIEIPFILTAPVKKEIIVKKLKRLQKGI